MNKEKRNDTKPRIGITMGDYNGVGPETIIKVLKDKRINNFFIPIVYGSGKILTKYKRIFDIEDFSYHQYNENSYLNEKKVNVVNCWQENTEIEPGKVTAEAGKFAFLALEKATQDLKSEMIDAVVTCPINKANIQSEDFKYAGHTEYFTTNFQAKESLMLMCHEGFRVGVATGHVALKDVPKLITRELLISKLKVLENALKDDFGIRKPRIAVLGLNPHAGEEGLLGDEENTVIAPTVSELNQKGHLVFGPYSADGFFGSSVFKSFDAILAMYHDQGLIPFKTIAFDRGVNYTAGLSVVRTSPDHGTAYNIAGKGVASETSLREALFLACDIVKMRRGKVERGLRPKHELDKLAKQ